MVDRVLNYEYLDRQASLIALQLESHRLQVAVAEAQYRTGQGSTASMISLWQRTEDLTARCSEYRIGQAQDRRELEVVTGEALETERISSIDGSGGCDCNRNPDS